MLSCICDHIPIGTFVSISSSQQPIFVKRRKLNYNPKLIGNVLHDFMFVYASQYICQPVYSIDTTSHCWLLEEQIRRCLSFAYPVSPLPAPKNKFATEFTLSLIKKHRSVLKSYFACFNSIFNQKGLLFLVFNRWAGNSARPADPLWFAHSIKQIRNLMHYKKLASICHKNVVIATRWDRQNFFNDTCSSLVSDIHDGNLNAMYSKMKSLKIMSASKASPKTKRVVNSKGLVTINATQSKEAFREHFTKSLQGKQMPFQELVKINRVHNQNKKHVCNESIESFASSCPALMDIASSMSSSKPNIAWGENNICPKIYKHLSSTLAALYYPLILKTWARIEPPLQWKGGILCELFKNKGLSTDVSNYRDIMLGDISGKFITKYIRKSLLPFALQYSRTTQFGGGFNGGETSFAHLYIRLAIDICKIHNKSCSVLFIDVISAFASLMRNVFFYNPKSDEEWAKSLSFIGFSVDEVSLIFKCILSPPWKGMYENNSSFLIAHEAYTNTWFSQDGISGVVATSCGSNAGMPLADLIFGFAMSRILNTFLDTVNKEGLSSYVPGLICYYRKFPLLTMLQFLLYLMLIISSTKLLPLHLLPTRSF